MNYQTRRSVLGHHWLQNFLGSSIPNSACISALKDYEESEELMSRELQLDFMPGRDFRQLHRTMLPL
jgi:hypothetical protein